MDTSPPARMSLVNLVTGDERVAQYNPEELEEKIGVAFADLQVPGLSHKRSHFLNTENVTFSFELFYSCVNGSGPAGLQAMKEDRKFIYALTHPWRADGIERGGSPRVLFVWPQLVSLTCKVRNVTFRYTSFNKEGAPTRWSAKMELFEIRDAFVGMEDILSQGTERSGFGPDGGFS